MTTLSPTTRDALTVKPSGQDKRGRVTEIPTSDPAVFLSVFTYHHKPGYRPTAVYRTSVMGVRHLPREAGDHFSSTLSAPMSALSVEVTEAGARFSAKALDAAHEAGLARVLELIESRLTGYMDDVLAATPTR